MITSINYIMGLLRKVNEMKGADRKEQDVLMLSVSIT